MVWQQWVLIGLYVVSGLLTIALIGKPRQPSTPGSAVFSVLLVSGMIALVVSI